MQWVGVAAFALVGGSTEFVRRSAVRFGLADRPGGRKGHERPTPYLGGVGIVAGVLLPTALAAGVGDPRLSAILLAAAAVAGLGLVDDLRPLSPPTRLVVETMAAAGVVIAGGGVAGGVGLPGVLGGRFDDVAAVVWIVAVTNAFNLLDNMDGAAAGVACVTAAMLSVPAATVGQRGIGILLLALSCGCAGFLPHNWTPARIFMGDAGSLFLGFVISASTVVIYAPSAHVTAIAGPLAATFVPTVDTAVVLVSRFRAGRPLLLGGTDHVAHRLRRLGLRTWQVAFLLPAATAVTCLGGIMVLRGRMPAFPLLVVAIASGVGLVWLLLKVPVYPPPEDPSALSADERSAAL